MLKNFLAGTRMAKQKSKGAPKDGSSRDRTPVKNNPQNPYTNPSVASKTKRGYVALTKKMGKN